jgi:hypothetical protein
MCNLVLVPDTAAEAAFWSELTAFYKSTLIRPWYLSSEQQQMLRKQERLTFQELERKRARKKLRDEKKKVEQRQQYSTRIL